MVRSLPLFSLLVAAVAVLGASPPPAATTPLGAENPPKKAPSTKKSPKKYRYVVAAVGDSLTDYKSHGGIFLKNLKKQCPKSHFDNYGRGGKMVNQMRRKFAADVLAEGKPAYTHVIIFGGVNDLYSDLTAGRTPSKVARDLLWMYEAARSRNIRVVALNVAPWGGFKRYYNPNRGAATRSLNRWILDQLDAGTVDYAIDTYQLLSCGKPEYLCPEYAKPFKDGIHFGPKGHERISNVLASKVFSGCL